jgi:hypothetical protein
MPCTYTILGKALLKVTDVSHNEHREEQPLEIKAIDELSYEAD